MLTLERWRRRSIYSLGGRRGTRASALTVRRQGWSDVRATGRMSGASGGAGCPGWGADVRAGGQNFWMFCSVAPDVRAFGRISGLGPDVRAGRQMSGLEGSATVVSVAWRRMSGRGARFPGLREEPDVRGDGRMSGLRWTFAVLSGWPMPDFRGSARMSGLEPDVRPL